MMRLPTLLGLSAAIALGGVAPAPAQEEPPRAEFEERVEVTEVLLDALVVDRRGNLVLGLGPGDFIVTEDGEEVELTSATFYTNRRFIEGSRLVDELAVDPRTIVEQRYFILFFEDPRRLLPRLVSRQLEAVRFTKRWIEGALQPNDFVAVFSYDARLRVHTDLTNDLGSILAALDDAAVGRDRGPVRSTRTEPEPRPSLLINLPRGKELRRESTTIYHALRLVSEAAGAIRGRKNLILYSTGFGRLSQFGLYVEDPRYYQPLVRTLNDNNIAVYSIDLFSALENHAMADGLNQLAYDTNGEYHFNFVSFITPLEEIARENNGYYLLSYRKEYPAESSGYQTVEVKMRNPELRVRARTGYLYGAD